MTFTPPQPDEEPVPEGPTTPPVDTTPDTETATVLASQLESVETMGNTALLNLQTATEQAERMLTEMQTRVDLGQMGAELLPPLQAALEQARQVYTELSNMVAGIQEQRAALEKA